MGGVGSGDGSGKEEQEVGHDDGASPAPCGRALVVLVGWWDRGEGRRGGWRVAGCSSHGLCGDGGAWVWG